MPARLLEPSRPTSTGRLGPGGPGARLAHQGPGPAVVRRGRRGRTRGPPARDRQPPRSLDRPARPGGPRGGWRGDRDRPVRGRPAVRRAVHAREVPRQPRASRCGDGGPPGRGVLHAGPAATGPRASTSSTSTASTTCGPSPTTCAGAPFLPPGASVLVHDAFSSIGVTLGILLRVLPARDLAYVRRTGSMALFQRRRPSLADRLRIVARAALVAAQRRPEGPAAAPAASGCPAARTRLALRPLLTRRRQAKNAGRQVGEQAARARRP